MCVHAHVHCLTLWLKVSLRLMIPLFSLCILTWEKIVLKRLYYSLFIGLSDHKIISIKFVCCIELLSLIQNKCTFHKKQMEIFHVH